MNAIIKKVGTGDIETIRELTFKIWPSTYTSIVGKEQVDYMLNLIYSPASLQNQIENLLHQFIIVYDDEKPVGFASYSPKSSHQPAIYRLHKIYVLPSQQRKGTGNFLMDYIISQMKHHRATMLELNVNRLNSAINFYKKLGFEIIQEEDIDIGNGFFMNDYVLSLQLPLLK